MSSAAAPFEGFFKASMYTLVSIVYVVVVRV